jgi:hypothetical protein
MENILTHGRGIPRRMDNTDSIIKYFELHIPILTVSKIILAQDFIT